MSSFREVLKDEMTFQDLHAKDLSIKSNISQRNIESYLSSREIIPKADAAVKLARALGVTVEYLVTGSDKSISKDFSKYEKYRDILEDLDILSPDSVEQFRIQIHAVAQQAIKNKSGVQAG